MLHARRASAALALASGLVLLGSLAALPAGAGSKRPASGELLGLHVGMDDRAALERLRKLGTPLGKTDYPKQPWALRDRRYGTLTVRFDSEWRLEWVTIFAREGGRRVRYDELGDMSRAHRSGTYIYTWTFPPTAEGRRIALTARGQDSLYVTSVSLHPAGPPPRSDPDPVDTGLEGSVPRDSVR